jgi:hypothetical protein
MQELNLKEAAKAARLSQWAYYPKGQFKRLAVSLLGVSPHDVHFIEDEPTDTQVYVVNHGNTSWVSFRGTEIDKLKDLITDARFRLVSFPEWPGRVFEGPAISVMRVRGDIAQALPFYHNKLIICGHSLGAVEAILYSGFFSNTTVRPFCTPRPGDDEFREWYDYRHDDVWCFSRHKDPIVRVPPYSMGYRHVGRQAYFHGNNELDLHTTPWERYADGVFGDMKDYLRLGDPWKDHSVKWIANRLGEISRQE